MEVELKKNILLKKMEYEDGNFCLFYFKKYITYNYYT